MAYLVLARKYRPAVFEAVIGQAHVADTLQNAIKADRVAHAILFSGPRGTGKTTVARILAKAMNCAEGPTPTPCGECASCQEITGGHGADVFEIDGASNNSVDQVRELRENLKYMPVHSRYKIYIIDEVHMLSTAAFNALLKTLEEPPAHVLFMFATTEVHKIPITILSRCQRHDLRRIALEQITAHMQDLCQKEDVALDEASLWLIARESEGSMRDALSMLDQVMAFAENGAVDHETVVDLLGVIDRRSVLDLTDALLRQDVPKVLETVDCLYQRGIELNRVYTGLSAYFRDLLIVKLGHQAAEMLGLPDMEIEKMHQQVASVSAAHLHQLFDCLVKEAAALRYAPQPRISLEMALIKLVHIQPAFTMDELIGKIDQLGRESLAQTDPSPPARPVSEDAVETVAVPNTPPTSKETLSSCKPAENTISETTARPPLQDPQESWRLLVEQLSETRPRLASVLAKTRLLAVTGDCLELSVAGPNLDLTLLKQNEAAISRAGQPLFGFPVKIKAAADASYQDKKEKGKKRIQRLKEEARSHEMVSAALEIFKGKIVDVIIPEERKDEEYEKHDETGAATSE